MHNSCFFFFNDTATTEIYTLSLHDALPIYERLEKRMAGRLDGRACEATRSGAAAVERSAWGSGGDRKSTRLNSSHANISYAVFCLKKKKNIIKSHSLYDIRNNNITIDLSSR